MGRAVSRPGYIPPDASAPTKLELFSWCMYDFANSAFPTIITMVAYAVYFTQVVAGGRPDATLLWSVAISISMILIGVVSPLIGAMADSAASKKMWVFVFTVMCIVPTALLFFVGPGDIVSGTVLFIIANIGFAGGNGIYNGFLPELTGHGNVGRLSGYGYALGYLGGLIALVVCLPLLSGGMEPEHRTAFKLSFVVTAVFFAVFSAPFFLWLKERAVPQQTGGVSVLRAGYERLSATFRRVRSLSELFKFLAAFLLYNDGIETVIYFSTIFAVSEFQFTMGDAVVLFIAVQGTALVGSILFGHVTDRIGSKPTIVITLLLWCVVVLAAFLATTRAQFWVIALTAGIGLGSNQAASRGLMRLFVPEGRDAEFYAFFSVMGKFSALLGPMVFGLVATATGSQRKGVLSVLFFFALGLLVLLTVDVEKGRLAARNAVAADAS